MSNVNFDPFVPGETADPFQTSEREDSTFAEMLSSFEQQHAEGAGGETVNGTIVSVQPENILVDIGRKMEGSLSLARWRETETGDPIVGATVTISIGPRNEEGYYDLSTIRIAQPKDWSGLQRAFAEKLTISGTVAEQ